MPTQPFCSGDLSKAKVLVIGHDPRLRESDTTAPYSLFADYYFSSKPTQRSELAKYQLAEKVYLYIRELTNQKYGDDQIAVTNLCNRELPHAPKGKTVYIPETIALEGIIAIQGLLCETDVEIIFAMSEQVNYWLQRLGFYPPVLEFLRKAEPKEKGVINQPPYYEPKQGRAFLHICCNTYLIEDQRKVIPILHVKSYPLKGAFAKAYAQAYETYISTKILIEPVHVKP